MKPQEIRIIQPIVMDRAEIMLRGYHIWLGSKLNIVENLGLKFDPFYDTIQDFYEIVWLIEHEIATKMVLERHKRNWRNKEFVAIHGVYVPRNLREKWERIVVKEN